MGARAFEGLKLRNGLLRELGPVQVLGVRCGGQLLLGDEGWKPGCGWTRAAVAGGRA